MRCTKMRQPRGRCITKYVRFLCTTRQFIFFKKNLSFSQLPVDILAFTMPYITDRKQFLREIELAMLIADDDDDDEVAEELLELYAVASFSRFTQDRVRRHRDDHFFVEKFPILTDAEFRSTFRTTRQGFDALVNHLKDHPVFSNNSTCPQLHPAWQIGIALARFGGGGNGSSVMSKQVLTGLAIGTIVLYTKRVVKALISVKRQWISWPDERRRGEIGRVMRTEGFPGCVGFIDGTGVPLSQKPAIDGKVYFDRKHRYFLVRLSIVCNLYLYFKSLTQTF